jgi:hypothetical protein
VKRMCLLILLCALIFGCDWFSPKVPALVPPTGAPSTPGPSKPTSDMSVSELEKAVADAKAEIKKAKTKLDEAETALKEGVLLARQHKLYWIGGICILAALGCIAGAIWLSNFYKPFLMGFAAFTVTAIAAFTFAALLPYLPWIIVGFVVLAAGTVFYFWKRDHKSLTQLVQGVEAAKPQLANYKQHFNTYLDSDVDAWITKLRTKMGLLQPKLVAPGK